uniref:NADH-ubiquinone oxidoreductase chain 4 n=1 Tax=Zygeupolia rubens TaxID=166045 RepID=I1SR59_9BILA|nr:NADH dehydrogenase subunit 4 [Zygeupolia rubens]ADZ05379.1 NADH dehydrogenase subunit 4 [Zygeupolia rubens]
MLVVVLSFSLLFLLFFSFYKWYFVIAFLFLYSFLGLFFFYNFGWWEADLWFVFDVVSVALVVLSLWLGGLMLMANWSVYLKKVSAFSFVFLVVLLVLVLVLAFFVGSFMQYYVLFELSLIPTFMLILGWGYQPERVSASMYMVIYTVGASLPLLGCLMYMFSEAGHLSFSLSFDVVLVGFYMKVFFFLFVLAFLVKIPVFFVHLWLPKAHVEAPVAGSMILAGVLLKLGGYGLVRVLEKLGSMLVSNNVFYCSFVMWGGVVTSVICLRQVDLKALIAYSSIGHMGMFVGGVMSNNVWGWQGGFLMLLGHGLCSPALFALANVNYESVGSRSVMLTKGLISFFPFLAFCWFLLSSSNMAAPPSLNLGSELMLFVGLVGFSGILMVSLGFMSFLAGAYSLYLYVSSQHGSASILGMSFLPVKVRSYFMILLHWVPLNVFFLVGDVFLKWS